MIRCSLGTAKVLGLKKTKIAVEPTTAYLMVGDRCKFNCSFCAQAREGNSRSDMLSRVVWPQFEGREVLAGFQCSEAKTVMQRICLQVVQDGKALEEAKNLVRALKDEKSPLPICVSAGPQSLEEIEVLFKLGVQRVSLALDAATPRVFAETKDGSWDSRYELLVKAAQRFPGRIGTHLIVGLGESEEDMVRVIQEMEDRGITVALFAFTPVKGTRLENRPKPDLNHYRRIQTSHFLIRRKFARGDNFQFGEGRISSFNLPLHQLKDYLADGEAFRTSGCTGCNRPYYNESPGEEPYNYPRPLTASEITRSWEQVIPGLREAGD